MQKLFHKGGRGQLPGGVVGLAEEHHIRVRVHSVQNRLRHHKIVFFGEKMPLHRAARRFQRGGVFRKGGGRHQSRAGLFGQHQPEDEVCRAIAAQQPPGWHILRKGKLCPQIAAQRVGVAVGGGQRSRNGFCHSLRQAERADVGRKIQRVAAVCGAVARPVAAVGQSLHHTMNSRITSPSTSARMLAAYIMRSARRMSCGSMGRRASPMVGFG